MSTRRDVKPPARPTRGPSLGEGALYAGLAVLAAAILYAMAAPRLFQRGADATREAGAPALPAPFVPTEKWLQRAYLLRPLFVKQYVAGWEAANGAIGDAYLYAITGDTALRRFHFVEHDLLYLFNGTWVDDRAWNALAEMYWWHVTGRTNALLVASAKNRYIEARDEGRLSNHEGYWSWYNWPPNTKQQDRVFTNSNMNQMVNVACWLYEGTGEKQFLDDALRVWNGDGKSAGIIKKFYRGKGVWKGDSGLAAFGKQLPWEGSEYCSIGASLYRVTKNPKIRQIVIATAKRILDPKTGWVHPTDFYQLRMDGNGAFVHYLMDAYEIAPDELADIPAKVEAMLEHVWTNAHGTARLTLHRETDHAIRNGWNPNGGEDGYGVDALGNQHAQTQALRAFAVFAYFKNRPPR
ncbi:MAG: hypothetical protein IPP94_14315 [Ignavibacteria bacterium]|nr:hypothetical protein [Ignavibacteria bacterium]